MMNIVLCCFLIFFVGHGICGGVYPVPVCPTLLYQLDKVDGNNGFAVLTDGCTNGWVNINLVLDTINVTNVQQNGSHLDGGIDVYLLNPRDFALFIKYSASQRSDIQIGVPLLKNITSSGRITVTDYGFELGNKYVIVNRFKIQITTSTHVQYEVSASYMFIVLVSTFGGVILLMIGMMGCFLFILMCPAVCFLIYGLLRDRYDSLDNRWQ